MPRIGRFSLLLVLLLGIGACTSKPVLNIEHRQTPAITKDTEQMRRAILQALSQRGWSIDQLGQVEILASIKRREHLAEIRIPYSATEYSIHYRGSQNLGYHDGKIHRNYNRWIQNLDRNIQQQLSRLSFNLYQ